ncbi:MAG: chemotaxis protein CheB [Luteimonas sp.]
MADRKRAALLARPGPASDQLRDALRHAGADVVLVADPGAIAADEVIAADPDSVLIVLDAAVEDILDRFDSVLGDPAINVIFEEADLAVAREGWNAARWARHLQAKLYGHQDVLPPGQSEDSGDDDHGHPRPGLPVTPQQQHADAAFIDFLGDFDGHADALPTDVVGAQPSNGFESDDYNGYGIADQGESARPVVAEQALAGLDDFLLAANADDNDALADSVSIDAAPASAAPAHIASSDWTLAADADSVSAKSSFGAASVDLDDLEQRVSRLTLAAHDSYGSGSPRGAVVVLAGLGGPDAVRQLLGGLPETFSRPVLVSQKLDAGQHEKLVKQMSRATKLPVDLAKAGEMAVAGHVYVLAPDVGLVMQGGSLMFSAHGDAISWLAALPASDSAIVLLSGSDPASVDQAMHLASSGALVMGQSVEGCFEPAAPAALAARGGESGLPPELARKLADRWPG